jgi:DNA modification methylase
VFRECRRVLADHGTLWVECGDSYAHGRNGPQGATGEMSTRRIGDARRRVEGVSRLADGCKPKDLIGQPWLLAFALRADGWYLRQAIVWHKPNAMPESVTDRCTTAHSYVFLFSKKPQYYFDAEAISEPAERARWGDQTVPKHEGTATAAGWIRLANGDGPRTKNARSVWTVATQGFPGAHFATWPEQLVERIVKAGCPEWVCGTCGKPHERIVGRGENIHPGSSHDHTQDGVAGNVGRRADGKASGSIIRERHMARGAPETVGWTDCGHGNYRPGRILDPFGGSGTTAVVARRLGRRGVLIELNEEYAEMARARLAEWWKPPARAASPETLDGQLMLPAMARTAGEQP